MGALYRAISGLLAVISRAYPRFLSLPMAVIMQCAAISSTTHTHTHTHTIQYTYTHIYTHTHFNTLTHTHNIHAHTHTHTHTLQYTNTHTTYMHTHTHTHFNTLTHTHTHTFISLFLLRGHNRVVVASLTFILHIVLSTFIPNSTKTRIYLQPLDRIITCN